MDNGALVNIKFGMGGFNNLLWVTIIGTLSGMINNSMGNWIILSGDLVVIILAGPVATS